MESAELLKRIRAEISKEIQAPGPEWKTMLQWAEEWGLQRAQAHRLVSQATRAGIMECQKFRIQMPMRDSYPVPHYREIKKT